MSVDPHRLLLLDTTVLVDVLRDTPTGRQINSEFKLTSRAERPLLCSVVEGEVLGLARLLEWGQDKLDKLCDLLNELVRVESSHPAIVAEYAVIYVDAHKNGYPKGENDLWIGATAKVVDAALVTSDKDFLWMNGRHLDVHHVPVVGRT